MSTIIKIFNKKIEFFLLVFFLYNIIYSQELTNVKVNGYKGIWFSIGQTHHGMDKYSGGLATFSAKHTPIAIYSEIADKTFFVYGGSNNNDKLSIMIGAYDHHTGLLTRPTEICRKDTDDPHDNAVITIDDKGYIYVFVSGRATVRKGAIFKSNIPYNIDRFSFVESKLYTYPQVWKLNNYYINLFTKYTGMRELYYRISNDFENWVGDIQMAAIKLDGCEYSGHYEISACRDGKLSVFFNLHPNGDVDHRTDLYYMETFDGIRWHNINGKEVYLPVTEGDEIKVLDWYGKKNVYLKDVKIDDIGNPICLYIRSSGYIQGSDGEPYELCVTYWQNDFWQTEIITETDHNYDTGCLIQDGNNYLVVAPTGTTIRHGCGGEVEIWNKTKLGWSKKFILTQNSILSHNYVRSVVNFKKPFCFLWADGDPMLKSPSHLYFGDLEGNVWMMPDIMEENYSAPIKIQK